MAKLLSDQITPSGQIRPIPDLSRTRKTNIPINTKKTTNKKLEDTDNILDEYIKKTSTGPGAGERFAICTSEYEIENDYDNIKYLENKLNYTSLSFDEHKKILDDISQIKENIPKK